MLYKKIIVLLLTGCILLGWQAVAGQVKLPRLVSDGMVLQRGVPIKIWGWAAPGENITVQFDGEKVSAMTGDDREWSVLLKPRKAGGPYIMEVSGINHIRLKDILVGDVWVCSGQSNMALPIIAHAGNPSIRQFSVATRYNFTGPLEDLSSGRWEPADTASVLRFTAAGYFFARTLFEKYHVPIGLLKVSAGDSPAEAWLSENALYAFPAYRDIAAKYKDSAYQDSIAEKDKVVQPVGLFNGMIGPLLSYAIKGVIWYQGEANTGKTGEYRTLFPALIADWRAHWKEGNFPFLYVQLANYGETKDQPSESNLAELREAQRLTLSVPATAMAVTTDIGEWNDIHPLDKEDVGRRLALAAEKLVYGDRWVVPSGPLYESMHISGNEIHVHFSNIGEGLVARGGGELRHFAIAGGDKKFVWAKARIAGDKVIVWNEQIQHPVAVRYGWADNPDGANLYNKADNKAWLPASPFSAEKK
ncbi:MAG TPA: sialate O-acetylesterase [Puia sp.]